MKLYKRQTALLDKWAADEPDDALHTLYDGLPLKLRTALERVKNTETLWSDVERYLGDLYTKRLVARRGSFETAPRRAAPPAAAPPQMLLEERAKSFCDAAGFIPVPKYPGLYTADSLMGPAQINAKALSASIPNRPTNSAGWRGAPHRTQRPMTRFYSTLNRLGVSIGSLDVPTSKLVLGYLTFLSESRDKEVNDLLYLLEKSPGLNLLIAEVKAWKASTAWDGTKQPVRAPRKPVAARRSSPEGGIPSTTAPPPDNALWLLIPGQGNPFTMPLLFATRARLKAAAPQTAAATIIPSTSYRDAKCRVDLEPMLRVTRALQVFPTIISAAGTDPVAALAAAQAGTTRGPISPKAELSEVLSLLVTEWAEVVGPDLVRWYAEEEDWPPEGADEYRDWQHRYQEANDAYEEEPTAVNRLALLKAAYPGDQKWFTDRLTALSRLVASVWQCITTEARMAGYDLPKTPAVLSMMNLPFESMPGPLFQRVLEAVQSGEDVREAQEEGEGGEEEEEEEEEEEVPVGANYRLRTRLRWLLMGQVALSQSAIANDYDTWTIGARRAAEAAIVDCIDSTDAQIKDLALRFWDCPKDEQDEFMRALLSEVYAEARKFNGTVRRIRGETWLLPYGEGYWRRVLNLETRELGTVKLTGEAFARYTAGEDINDVILNKEVSVGALRRTIGEVEGLLEDEADAADVRDAIARLNEIVTARVALDMEDADRLHLEGLRRRVDAYLAGAQEGDEDGDEDEDEDEDALVVVAPEWLKPGAHIVNLDHPEWGVWKVDRLYDSQGSGTWEITSLDRSRNRTLITEEAAHFWAPAPRFKVGEKVVRSENGMSTTATVEEVEDFSSSTDSWTYKVRGFGGTIYHWAGTEIREVTEEDAPAPEPTTPMWQSDVYGRVKVVEGARGQRDVWHNIQCTNGCPPKHGYGFNGQRWARNQSPPPRLRDEVVAHGWGHLFGWASASPAPTPAPDVLTADQLVSPIFVMEYDPYQRGSKVVHRLRGLGMNTQVPGGLPRRKWVVEFKRSGVNDWALNATRPPMYLMHEEDWRAAAKRYNVLDLIEEAGGDVGADVEEEEESVYWTDKYETDDYPSGRHRVGARWFVEYGGENKGFRICRETEASAGSGRWIGRKCTNYGVAAAIRVDPEAPYAATLCLIPEHLEWVYLYGGNMKQQRTLRADEPEYAEYQRAILESVRGVLEANAHPPEASDDADVGKMDPEEYTGRVAKELGRLKKSMGATSIRQNYKGTGSKRAARQLWIHFDNGAVQDIWVYPSKVELGRGVVHNRPSKINPIGKTSVTLGGRDPYEAAVEVAEVLRAWAHDEPWGA